ncbi:MAG: class I SAM-dependent methyltransferase [Armatimonadota bacterium]|nr:class I SAM-dependent methyltransferase [Armatimonadota bacterium]
MGAWYEQDEFWEVFYNALYTEVQWAAATEDVEQLLALAGTPPGASVLDLPCGPGRHSLALARRGFRVTGVDLNAAYLGRARRRAEEEGLNVEWVRDNMRRFCRPEAFDLVINLYTSFGYFEDPADDRAVALNFWRSLRPGGALVMELEGKEIMARDFRPREWRWEADGSPLLVERTIRPGWDWVENRWILIRGATRHDFVVSHRLYSATELTGLLREMGFGVVKSFGNLSGAPYDHRASKLVVVARKESSSAG